MKQLFSYLSLVGLFIGLFVYFTSTNDHLHSSGHPVLELPNKEQIPELNVKVEQLADESWLLKLEKRNFTFTPEQAGSSEVDFHKGHGHLYINGRKITRLYGDYYFLELEKGKNVIKVSLVSNNHQRLYFQGNEIADTIEVKVPGNV